MLNNLLGYCYLLRITPLVASEEGINFKCTILDKYFSLVRKDDNVRITTFDDTVFNAFCAVLQPKYKTLLTIRRNVTLLGDSRPYNLIEFCCAKETKLKIILGLFEKVYVDILNEKKAKENDEKVG